MARCFILTCIDYRLNDLAILNEGHYVYRNGGAVLTADVWRSLLAAVRLGNVQEILVIKHTDCLFNKVTDEEFHELLAAHVGPCQAEITPNHITSTCSGPVNGILTNLEFASFRACQKALKVDVATLCAAPQLSLAVHVTGYICDTDSKKLTVVVRSL